jgi:hypothetical protein
MARGSANSKRNTSGQGGKGTAPFSRGPVVGAVTPKGPKNPNAQGGPIRTGGGEGSNKHTKITPVVGSNQTRKTNVDAVSNSGRAVGNHASDSGGGNTTTRPNVPLHQPAKAATMLGNAKALEVGRGGPGTGRTVHPSGGQSYYGQAENLQGMVDSRGSISPHGSGNAGSPTPTRPMGPSVGSLMPGFPGKR